MSVLTARGSGHSQLQRVNLALGEDRYPRLGITTMFSWSVLVVSRQRLPDFNCHHRSALQPDFSWWHHAKPGRCEGLTQTCKRLRLRGMSKGHSNHFEQWSSNGGDCSQRRHRPAEISLRRFPAATQPYRQRQERFSEQARNKHVSDQSTNIASSVPDAVYRESPPLSPISEILYHGSYQSTDETPCRELRGTRCIQLHRRPTNHARNATIQPFRLPPSATARPRLFSRMKRTIIGLRPPFWCNAAINILGSFSCSKGTSAEDGRALNTFSAGTCAFSWLLSSLMSCTISSDRPGQTSLVDWSPWHLDVMTGYGGSNFSFSCRPMVRSRGLVSSPVLLCLSIFGFHPFLSLTTTHPDVPQSRYTTHSLWSSIAYTRSSRPQWLLPAFRSNFNSRSSLAWTPDHSMQLVLSADTGITPPRIQ
jgi:hypothetical protein